MKFAYNNPYEKVVDKAVAKLRRDNRDVIEKGFVSLEKHKTDANALDIFVYRYDKDRKFSPRFLLLTTLFLLP